MWDKAIPQFSWMADRERHDRRSRLFVFEEGRQLPHPHAIHDDIDKYRSGRFFNCKRCSNPTFF
jgi:hypothetical protein